MTSAPYKIVVIGLDGGTLDILGPLMGETPHLASLMRDGVHGTLESTYPPITPCAWSSFITGKNPGKHGLFDFVEPNAKQGSFQFTNATFRSGDSLWKLLNQAGRSVGVVNVPMTYPPESVDGFLISGLDTPHDRSPFMHPPEIRKELKQAGVRYRIDLQHLGNMRTDAIRQATLNEIFEGETQRTDALLHLSRTRPADFRMIVYGATDQVQHHFWHFMDPDHDKHDAEGAKRFGDAIPNTYRHVDELVGRILEDCDEQTIVMVMSDHGFGPTTNVRVRLNQVLEEAGLLTFVRERSAGRFKRALAGVVDGLIRSTLSSDMKRTISGMLPGVRAWFETLDEAKVDWERTVAYVNEAYRSSPAVWVQRDGMSDEDVDRVLDQVEEALRLVKHPQTGEQVISEFVRTRNVYDGAKKQKAPDLLLSWWKDGFLLEQSSPGSEKPPSVECSTEPIQGGVEFAASHRMDGVFMARGGPFLSGHRCEHARIIDVAPTVLYLMGCPIPQDMDGRVLSECIESDYLDKHPIQSGDRPGDDDQDPTPTTGFDKDEEALIRQRLQALGYIE